MDFVYGALRSPGGMPIIAMPSTAKDGTISRIVPMLKQGAGVVTTRNHVACIVTEYGVARLYGRTIRQRVQELVNIAAPQFRDELLEFAAQTALGLVGPGATLAYNARNRAAGRKE